MLDSIGKRVRFLRMKKMKTVNDLVNEIKIPVYNQYGEIASYKQVTKGTIGNLENDRNDPNIHLIIAISEYFDVSVDWILKGKEHEGQKLGDPSREELQFVLDNTKQEIIQELEEKIREIKSKY
ncbi:helix-turn-helix domain-containing protein [Paenibacillus sp. ACRSA]|uniref:helix-turn-helix domain-containing protein n=1 Tax=Paenibacillus sp. ACRSA TaxID=2918211 RepID=UPI001EF3ED29|nr:helix-turn-helix transcriptional regulator [Paenibacillus sp. ACRSA]MCG7377414.1 helix-turn-helix domain-containing protein [Paenibacillus sp. ACRSA]